jgi:phosphoribosylformylglycinamidine synthase subunit PurS
LKARVTIYPRPEVLDPQGKAVHQALTRVGFDGVNSLRIGKSFDIELKTKSEAQAMKQLEAMCDKLLANRVMEVYEIEIQGKAGK